MTSTEFELCLDGGFTKERKKIDTQLNNREIRSRYKERKNQQFREGEKLCIFGCAGWLCLKTEHRKHHDLNLNGILNLNAEDIKNLDIKDLICPYHLLEMKAKKQAELEIFEPENFGRMVRAEMKCKLNNVKNILRYLYWKKDVAKIVNNLDTIHESKFTENEKRGNF